MHEKPSRNVDHLSKKVQKGSSYRTSAERLVEGSRGRKAGTRTPVPYASRIRSFSAFGYANPLLRPDEAGRKSSPSPVTNGPIDTSLLAMTFLLPEKECAGRWWDSNRRFRDNVYCLFIKVGQDG